MTAVRTDLFLYSLNSEEIKVTYKNSEFCLKQYICVLRMVLTINIDCSPKQH
jgi:hypothetical protein